MTTTTAKTTGYDDQLEADYLELKAILDDPIQLLQRLWELEQQRRGHFPPGKVE